MECAEGLSLECAKAEFLSLLSRVDPAEAGSFVHWVIQQCCGVNENVSIENKNLHTPYAEKMLRKIIKDITKRVPPEGVLVSENINPPDRNGKLPLPPTVHVDAFLYSDEDVDRLCDEGRMSRNYCKDCGSHNTAPLTFISHSSSLAQLKFIFCTILPGLFKSLEGKLLVDIGSRLGAVLYGGFYFSALKRLVGVEINNELCKLQQEMIEKYNMTERVEVRCADICKEVTLLKEADIVVLNNVFEFFLPVDEQVRTWKILHKTITKPGCVLVTVPSLEESTVFDNQPCIDIESWVKPISLHYNMLEIWCSEDDIEEFQNIFVYQVK